MPRTTKPPQDMPQSYAKLRPTPRPVLTEKVVPFPTTLAVSGPRLWLDERRDGYEEKVRWWQFLRECYEGGREWLNGKNLPPHALEVEGPRLPSPEARLSGSRSAGGAGTPGLPVRDVYDLRLQAAFRFNLVADVVDAYSGFLSASPPARSFDGGSARLSEVEQAADRGRSRTLDEIVLACFEDAALLGEGYLVVDVAQTAANIAARLEAAGLDAGAADARMPAAVARAVREGDGLPYFYTVAPEDILNFVPSPDGSFSEVLVREHVSRGSLTDGSGGPAPCRYRLWTRDAWSLWEVHDDGHGRREAVVVEGPELNAIGVVPVFRLQVRRPGLSGYAKGKVDDVALIDRALADLCSSLAYGLGNSSEQQVNVFHDRGAMQGMEDVKKAAADASYYLAASAPVGLFDSKDKVVVLEKSFTSATVMLQAFLELYRQAMRSTGLGEKVDEPTDQSGISRLRAAAPLNATLSRFGVALQRLETAALRAASLYLGAAPAVSAAGSDTASISVSYPRNYDVLWVEALILLRKELDGRAPAAILNWITGQIIDKSFPSRTSREREEHDAALADFEPEPEGSDFDELAARTVSDAGFGAPAPQGRAARRVPGGAQSPGARMMGPDAGADEDEDEDEAAGGGA